jgi:RNA polymerase sigma-70 factor (ECF subfamily)
MLNDRTSDEDLVRWWQTGESRERVFAILHQRYAPELARTFRRMRFDDEICKELIQETLLQVFRGLDGFRHGSSFRTWLHQIGRNAALKRIRGRKTLKRTGEQVPLDEVGDLAEEEPVARSTTDDRDDPLGRVLLDEQKRQVWAALSELPVADQIMVRLRIWQDLSVRETAQALNKPEGTIKSGWARIRGALKERLGSQFSDLPY